MTKLNGWWQRIPMAWKATLALGAAFAVGGAADRLFYGVIHTPDAVRELQAEFAEHTQWGEVMARGLLATDDSLWRAVAKIERELNEDRAWLAGRVYKIERRQCQLMEMEGIHSADCPPELPHD